MNEQLLADIAETLALTEEKFFAIDDEVISELKTHVAKLVQPPPGSKPPTKERQPLEEIRVISTPENLNWQQRDAFPLLMAEVRSHQREWEVHANQNRFFVVSSLDAGWTQIIVPLEQGRRMPQLPPSRSGEPPNALGATLSSAWVNQYDLLRWTSRERLQGRLAITEFDFDLTSNTVGSVAGGLEGQPVLTGFLQDSNRVSVQKLPFDRGEAGVRFQVQSSESSTLAQAQINLRDNQVATMEDRSSGVASRFLAASVLFVQLDNPAPTILDLKVSADTSVEAQVQAAFTVDLQAVLKEKNMAVAGDVLVYLVVGEVVAGPESIRLSP